MSAQVCLLADEYQGSKSLVRSVASHLRCAASHTAIMGCSLDLVCLADASVLLTPPIGHKTIIAAFSKPIWPWWGCMVPVTN